MDEQVRKMDDRTKDSVDENKDNNNPIIIKVVGVVMFIFCSFILWMNLDSTSVSTLPTSGTVHLLKHKVTFNDLSTAEVSVSVRIELSDNEEELKKLSFVYGDSDTAYYELIKDVIGMSLKNSATYMTPVDAYINRRAEFSDLVSRQIKLGIFETHSYEIQEFDPDSNMIVINVRSIKKDKYGEPVIAIKSPLLEYNIDVTRVIIREVQLSDTVMTLMQSKKEAERKRVVEAKAIANLNKLIGTHLTKGMNQHGN